MAGCTNSDLQIARGITRKNLYFETIKGVGVGTLLGVVVGIATTIISQSRNAGRLVLPERNEINQLLNNKTTLSIGAVFGYFGIKDTLRNNREFERVVTKQSGSFSERRPPEDQAKRGK